MFDLVDLVRFGLFLRWVITDLATTTTTTTTKPSCIAMRRLLYCCPLLRNELWLLRHGVVHTAACSHLTQMPSLHTQRKYSQLIPGSNIIHQRHTCLTGIQLRHVHGAFSPVNYAYTYMNWVHDFTGVPWWISIAITIIPLRVLLGMVCQRYSHHNKMKEEPLKRVMVQRVQELRPELRKASLKFTWTEEERMKVQRIQLNKIQKKEMIKLGYHPLKSFMIIMPTLPIWISISMSLFKMVGQRGVAGDIIASFATEGTLWFPNLMVPDATLLIPFIFMMVSLANTEVHDLSRDKEQAKNKFFITMTWVARVFSIFLFVISTQMPTALPLYWTYSTLSALVINLIMMSPSVRSYLLMPRLKTDSLTPYSDLYTAARTRYDLRRFMRKDS